MKILVVNNNTMFKNENGLFIFKKTGEFLQQLSELGVEVETFHFQMPFGDNDFMATYNVCNKGIKVTSVKRLINRWKYYYYLKAYFIGLFRVLSNDYVYIFYPNSFLFLTLFSILFRKPYGIYLRGESNFNSKISMFLFKRADIVLTVSPYFTEYLQEKGCRSETIRPMIDYYIQDIVYGREYKQEEFYKLLFLARIEEQKGIFDLIRAVNELIVNGVCNFRLDVVGDGPDANKAKEMVNSLNLKPYITFHGTVSDKSTIRNFYLNSNLFVFPTHPSHEGFPRVLYEAMILGLPILTTRVGAISYLMKDSYNCIEISHSDYLDIAKKLLLVFKNYLLCKEMAENATTSVHHYLNERNEYHHEQLFRLIKERV